MTKRRLLGTLFFGGALLATGVVPPAGAAPPAPANSSLLGPDNRPCGGGMGAEPVGTAVIQSAKTRDPGSPDERALRVNISADNVRARTTYNVSLAATVVEGSSVGCRQWVAGTTVSSPTGKIGFSGAVNVPAAISAFQVWVGPPGPATVGYTTAGINVSGL